MSDNRKPQIEYRTWVDNVVSALIWTAVIIVVSAVSVIATIEIIGYFASHETMEKPPIEHTARKSILAEPQKALRYILRTEG